MNSIPLEPANLIADKALQKDREFKFAPLTVIVLEIRRLILQRLGKSK